MVEQLHELFLELETVFLIFIFLMGISRVTTTSCEVVRVDISAQSESIMLMCSHYLKEWLLFMKTLLNGD